LKRWHFVVAAIAVVTIIAYVTMTVGVNVFLRKGI
jgi:hypothetical protein